MINDALKMTLPGVAVLGILAACARDPVAVRRSAVAPSASNGWAFSLGGEDSESIDAMAVDRAGSVVMVGTFAGSFAVGSSTLTASGDSRDIYLVKLNAGGAVLWARGFGGTGTDQARDLKIDADGGIYVAGSFLESIQLESHTATSAGGSDAFVAAFGSDGVPRWLTGLGGPGLDSAERLVVLADGTLLMAGAFSETITLAGAVATSQGSTDVLLARLSRLDGAVSLDSSFGGESADSVRSLIVQPDSRLILGGSYRGAIRTSGGALSAAGSSDGFISSAF